MATLPDGWTDDMRIPLPPGVSNEKIVAVIFPAHFEFEDWDSLCRRVMADFGLPEDDSLLAIDRVQGGMVRAVTGNPANRPDRIKDPLAYLASQRIWSELPRAHFFSRHRNTAGKWETWSGESQLRHRLLKKRLEPEGG